MELKDLATIGALVVSGYSAWTATDARNRAAELESKQFAATQTMDILARVYGEVTQVDKNSPRAKWSCFFVQTLGEAEASTLPEPHHVRTFVTNVTNAGLWNANCAVLLEGIVSPLPVDATQVAPQMPDTEFSSIDAAPAPFPTPAFNPDADSTTTATTTATDIVGVTQIGQWHALIASYDTTPKGCAEARADVAYFADALSGQGLDGRHLYIVRTKISNNYAVTVDAGDDRARADEISAAIRRQHHPDGTGRDSFVQGNREWTIDPGCADFAVL